jgi:hypothetical protein
MWFAAISPGYASGWFERFVLKLLEADRRVLRLLDHDPFGGQRPRYVRARLYRYRYSSWARLRADHVWWERNPVRVFLPPVSLERYRRAGDRG